MFSMCDCGPLRPTPDPILQPFNGNFDGCKICFRSCNERKHIKLTILPMCVCFPHQTGGNSWFCRRKDKQPTTPQFDSSGHVPMNRCSGAHATSSNVQISNLFECVIIAFYFIFRVSCLYTFLYGFCFVRESAAHR